MSADLRPEPTSLAARRGRRVVAAGVVAGCLWLAIALSASAESPAGHGSTDTAPAVGQVTPSPTIPLASAPPVPTPIAHKTDGDKNTCADCHEALKPLQADIVTNWQASVHAAEGVTCADCHGGDPTSDQITVAMSEANGFVGAPGRTETVGLCGSCHADTERMRKYGIPTDQYAKYWTSVHGQRLATSRDDRVAICTDCHGSHDVKKASDPTARVSPLNVPTLCASCHADAARMQPYGIPTDQFAIYSQSVHGVALLDNKDVRAPSCASCHGSHDAKPPQATEVVEVCGKCHTATQALYEQSRHSELGTAAPKCWTCHGTHDVSQPGQQLFFHPTTPDYQCNTCHDLQTKQLRLELDRFKSEADRRCDTCHHPNSLIYAQVQGIADALGSAQSAYDAAGAKIEDAARLGMITADADVGLTQARTSLIQAQAAVHTTKLPIVSELSTDATGKAQAAEALATAKIDESTFRRQAMIVVLALIFANVVFLYLLKRRLDRNLERR
jgi:hypothetical protein